MVGERTEQMLLKGKPREGEKKKDLEENGWMMLNWT
jgi:hypothetical protein